MFDCRPFNVLCKKPPTTELSTAAAFSNLDWSDEQLNTDVNPGLDMHFASLDLADSFYQLGYDKLSPWMCLDFQVRAGDVGVTEAWCDNTQGLVAVEPSQYIWPSVCAMAMGCSWSLWFCQDVLCNAMLESESRRQGLPVDVVKHQLLSDRLPTPVLAPNRPTIAGYVDNGNIIG